jgi:hypothetical protein
MRLWPKRVTSDKKRGDKIIQKRKSVSSTIFEIFLSPPPAVLVLVAEMVVGVQSAITLTAFLLLFAGRDLHHHLTFSWSPFVEPKLLFFVPCFPRLQQF